jgi:hypothetical protein
MSNDPNQTTADTESESMRATRRTVLRGAGVAGLLTMGVGTASAQRVPEAERQARQYAENARAQGKQQKELARTQAAKTPKSVKKTPKGIEKAKTKVPSFVKDKLDIKFPGSGGGGGNGDGISG